MHMSGDLQQVVVVKFSLAYVSHGESMQKAIYTYSNKYILCCCSGLLISGMCGAAFKREMEKWCHLSSPSLLKLLFKYPSLSLS